MEEKLLRKKLKSDIDSEIKVEYFTSPKEKATITICKITFTPAHILHNIINDVGGELNRWYDELQYPPFTKIHVSGMVERGDIELLKSIHIITRATNRISEGDEYDENKGREISSLKAYKALYKYVEFLCSAYFDLLSKYVNNMGECYMAAYQGGEHIKKSLNKFKTNK